MTLVIFQPKKNRGDFERGTDMSHRSIDQLYSSLSSVWD